MVHCIEQSSVDLVFERVTLGAAFSPPCIEIIVITNIDEYILKMLHICTIFYNKTYSIIIYIYIYIKLKTFLCLFFSVVMLSNADMSIDLATPSLVESTSKHYYLLIPYYLNKHVR